MDLLIFRDYQKENIITKSQEGDTLNRTVAGIW
jgi:hypothetical protein